MSAEERLKGAGFRKQNESGGDSCLFCNHYHLSSDKTVEKCELHGVRFWDGFSSGDYVCRNFDSSMLDSLLDMMNKENSESATLVSNKQELQSSPKEGYIAIVIDMIVMAIVGGLVGGGIKFFQWIAADLTFGILVSMPTSDSILPMILRAAAIGAVIGLVIGIFEAINEKRK